MTITITRPQRTKICGFCATNSHTRCAIGVRNQAGDKIHPCLCDQAECATRGRHKCTACGNRTATEVDPDTWECIDRDACRALIEARREASPLSRELREARRSADMAKVENAEKKATAKAEKEPTYCLVTGEPTKGGLFKPGMDARYVSNMVEAVTSKSTTEAKARKQMKDDGVSEKLIAKFDKSLALAREKAEKRAQAEKDKAAAKAAKS